MLKGSNAPSTSHVPNKNKKFNKTEHGTCSMMLQDALKAFFFLLLQPAASFHSVQLMSDAKADVLWDMPV